jgi:transporter family protein
MSWILWAVISAVAAGLTSVFAKAGLEDVAPNLGNAIRTGMILVLCVAIAVVGGESAGVSKLSGRAWLMLGLSAVATAVSWVAFFHALAGGPATPVTAIDRSSLVVTMVLAVAFFGEPFSIRTTVGVLLVVTGAVLASIPAK